jgi:hypothetical protein
MYSYLSWLRLVLGRVVFAGLLVGWGHGPLTTLELLGARHCASCGRLLQVSSLFRVCRIGVVYRGARTKKSSCAAVIS